ncbi:MAG TPA: hypothetical protein VFN23_15120 [Ktedonobacteraceae bacterium]|nr:hypothetical protein [Ktedonobacteraceae bacterium]
MVVLPEPASSWTSILDQQRVSTDTTASHLAFAQLSALAPSLPKQSIVVLNRAYDATWLGCQCSTLPLTGTLVRLKKNRRFFRQATPRTGKPGTPRLDGETLQGQDERGRPLEIAWWQHLYLNQRKTQFYLTKRP